MLKHRYAILLLLGIVILFLTFGMVTQAQAQWFYPYYNPFFGPYSRLSFGFYPPVMPVYPFLGAPVVAPPLPSRVGAATIIITNPTAGTVSVLNPTVASVPTVTAAVASPPPLLSLLATVYSTALYEGALSTENPLLFALLQNLFL